ncbi:MAG: aminotransferase class I/II-fold pyridoxal phosphate-dependent enzyme [Candidatus Omnitrophica bacterium]|nr:aminotransferase class I/II-fold pyridoxal phosphate-dependent enzyme [Candidatus Omnitrophota bacterium]
MIIPRRVIKFYPGFFRDMARILMGIQTLYEGQVRSFEAAVANYSGVKFAAATASGREALKLILKALKLSEGDEVIMPAYTLLDLARMVRGLKLRPVFVDVDVSNMNMAPALIREKITSRTRVIVATHLFGLPCDIEQICQLAQEHGVVVVEDCAHALGAKIGQRPVGMFGQAAFFSFSVGKQVNTFGGGMVVSNDAQLIASIRQDLGQRKTGYIKVIFLILLAVLEKVYVRSWFFRFSLRSRKRQSALIALYRRIKRTARSKNGRFSSLQAYIGNKQLGSLEEALRSRENTAQILREKLKGRFDLQQIGQGRISSNYFFIIRPKNKMQTGYWVERFIKAGIDVGTRGEIMGHCPRFFGEPTGQYPATDILEENNIQIPFYEGLSEQQIRYIVSIANGEIPGGEMSGQ